MHALKAALASIRGYVFRVPDPIATDKAHCWHPFTPQDAWCDPAHDPLMIVRAEGVWL